MFSRLTKSQRKVVDELRKLLAMDERLAQVVVKRRENEELSGLNSRVCVELARARLELDPVKEDEFSCKKTSHIVDSGYGRQSNPKTNSRSRNIGRE
jgi:hypothetical protein